MGLHLFLYSSLHVFMSSCLHVFMSYLFMSSCHHVFMSSSMSGTSSIHPMGKWLLCIRWFMNMGIFYVHVIQVYTWSLYRPSTHTMIPLPRKMSCGHGEEGHSIDPRGDVATCLGHVLPLVIGRSGHLKRFTRSNGVYMHYNRRI